MLELKTTPPFLRSGLVARTGLLRRLENSSDPVVALVAPAGYGKTTLLGQFAALTDRPLAWLTHDEEDSDPTVLITGLSYALTQAGLLREARGSATLDPKSVLTRGVNQLLAGVDADANGILILDQLDEIPSQHSFDVVGALMARARGRLQVMVATRSGSRLPFGLLRGQGDLLELRADDLALDATEVHEVFDAVRAPEPESIDEIMDHTEGWPVAVYLTALAMEAGGAAPGGVRGDDTYLAEYFREELMKDVPDRLESFLSRSSILSRMSGRLCDHVLGIEHSARLLEELQETNLLVVPMDRNHTWYRYHSLLRQYLQSELHRNSADQEASLHERASTWFEENGFDQAAIDHARQADDPDRVADLLARSARTFFATGRSETLSGWMEWLEGRQSLSDHPELAAVGAMARLLTGDPGGSERLAHLAFNDSTGRPREESELGPLTLMLRSYQAPSGVERAIADARAAHEDLRHRSGWGHASLGGLALAMLGAEGIEASEPMWVDTMWRAESIEARPSVAVARAMRALAAIERGDWDAAEAGVAHAITEIEQSGLEGYATSALGYVTAARVATHGGDPETGRALMNTASRMRPLLSAAFPIYSVLTLHEEAKAYVELADIAGARRVMREAADILAIRPRLGTLVEDHRRLKERLAELPAGTVGPSSLTRAELRLLPLLITHLTYPEIGDRLYISKHTVKTQAMSIYRKLGVTSRGEAVETARKIGLIST